MGLAFLLQTEYLLPLMLVALVAAVGALRYRASQRHGRGPFAVGLVAAALLLSGRFLFASDLLTYLGAGLMIAASVWNSWPKKRPASPLVELSFSNDAPFPDTKENEAMTTRKVEVFSAGCSLCDNAVKLVESIACPSCDVEVLDMQDQAVASRAASLGGQRVPAVVIDGKLADCCASGMTVIVPELVSFHHFALRTSRMVFVPTSVTEAVRMAARASGRNRSPRLFGRRNRPLKFPFRSI